VRERDGAVSFGFLVAPAPHVLAKKLKERPSNAPRDRKSPP